MLGGGGIRSLKNKLINQNINFTIQQTENNAIDIIFEKPVNMRDIDFLYFRRKNKDIEPFSIEYFSDKPSLNKLLFTSNTKDNLIPLDALPSFLVAKNITSIRLRAQSHISYTEIKFYKNKKNIEYGL